MFECRGTITTVLNGMHHSIFPSMPPRAFWVMGGVWSANHIMEHYRYGEDLDYLRDVSFPILKEHVAFTLDWMVRHPETEKWVLGPNVSPENTYALSKEALKRVLSRGHGLRYGSTTGLATLARLY